MNLLVLKLREIRRIRGLSQVQVAEASGIGEKTISSFETGCRIGSLKFAQLEALLAVYGMTLAEFALWTPDATANEARDGSLPPDTRRPWLETRYA